MPFEMKPLTSDLLVSGGYDAESKTLRLKFRKEGVVYTFNDVPKECYDKLCEAKSPGGFFAANVRDKFDFTREKQEKSDGDQATTDPGV